VPETPAGFVTHTDEGVGYTVAVPSDWQSVSAAGGDLSTALDELAASNPALASAVAGARPLIAQGGQVLAVDVNTGATVALIKLPALLPLSVPIAGDAIRTQLEALGATGVQVVEESIPAGPAIRVDASLPVTLSDGSTVVIVEQLYIVNGSDVSWMLVLSSPADSVATDTFDAVVATLRVA
jgi:hypothetical protein